MIWGIVNKRINVNELFNKDGATHGKLCPWDEIDDWLKVVVSYLKSEG